MTDPIPMWIPLEEGEVVFFNDIKTNPSEDLQLVQATEGETEFPRHNGKRDGLQTYCKVCHRASCNGAYSRYKDRIRAATRRHRARNRDWIILPVRAPAR